MQPGPEQYAMTENDESDSSSSTSDEEELGNNDKEEQEQRDVANTNLIKNLLMIVS